MYRIFCESCENYLKQYNDFSKKSDYRYKIFKPLELLKDVNEYKRHQLLETELYKQLSDFLFYLNNHTQIFPKANAFLWTLESRGINSKYYGIAEETDLIEQAKICNLLLSLLYWN